MARTDAARGVWKAPAGMEADLKNILGLEVKLTGSVPFNRAGQRNTTDSRATALEYKNHQDVQGIQNIS